MTNTLQNDDKPILFVDVDGVLSLFDFVPDDPPAGSFHSIDGIAHLLSATAGEYLRALAEEFELVWCTGWEDRANEHLPHLLGLPGPLPCLHFGVPMPVGNAHWKLAAVAGHAGDRPAAWIDDSFSDDCHAWAACRAAPTLLVDTQPAVGLTADDVEHLLAWARGLRPAPAEPPPR